MENEKAAFTKSVEITEKAIISRGKELKEFVDQCTWSLLEDLTTIKYDGLKAMEKCENEEFGSHVLLYDRSETYRTDFKSTFSADDGFAQRQQPSKTPTQERIISIRISFEISKLEDFLKGNNIIGRIKREDKLVAAETADAQFGLHDEDDEENTTAITTESDQRIVDDEATAIENAFDADEKKADETILNAEEYKISVEHKEETPVPMKVEAEFPETEKKETKETKKETKTKTPKRKRQDRNQIALQDVTKLPLLCATYTYGDQQIPVARVRRSQSISLIKTLELSRVWGVTKLDDSIYVLSWMPNSIRVYWDWDPFPLYDEIPIEGIQNPEDIASSAKTRCLYVSDTHDKCIWEITVADHQVTKWLSNVDWPFTLSMSSDGHLLLLRDTQNALEIYGSDARLIRSLRLPTAIQRSLHAIQKPNGQFLIVHRLMDRETGEWVISHLTNDGQLMGHFIPQTGSLLDWPFHMALDSEDDRLFVADYWNHRVIRCDSLNWSQTILKETIHRPLRLHYDVRKKQLIVANSRRLDIYIEH